MDKGRISELIRNKLIHELQPVVLEVTDVSHKHSGHQGARPEGETHFEVHIVSECFRGLSRVARHQLVYSTLAQEMNHPIHALAIRAEVPEQV